MKELVLFAGVGITVFLLNFFKYDHGAQILVAFLGCMYYVSWGIIHHALQERINRSIIFEYVLVGSVMFLLVLLALTLI